ncbi:MAG: site-2 protease family protein [Bryobacteraceae bacterium]
MKWSWKLGKFAGVDLYVHMTFVLFLGFIVLTHLMSGRGIETTVGGVGFILAIFASVLLHEYGHALAARKYGIQTRDITLLPIGGVARLERMPEDPKQELWVALAGPAVNVAIAAVLFAWLTLSNTLEPLGRLSITAGSFVERIMAGNIVLVLFNLIPAFPMDGGRVLRAILASRMDYTRATQIAAALGQGSAFVLGFAGLFYNPFLMFVALFVWIGAAQESGMVQMRAAFGGTPVAKAMLTDFRTLGPYDTLGDAVELILRGSQQDFPVLQGSAVVGILTRADLLIGLARLGASAPVSSVMRREFESADSSEMLESVFTRLQACNCHTLPAMHDGRLVGLVTMDNLGEFLMIETALRGGKAGVTEKLPAAA